MFGVGKVSDKAQHLCDVTLEALEAAISHCGPGIPVRKIGEVQHSLMLIICVYVT